MILFALILVLLCAMVAVFALLGLYTVGSDRFGTTSRSRFLEVLDKNGQIVGYLLGSLHTNLEAQEMESTVKVLNQLLPRMKHVYAESIVGHWTKMPEGLEKALLKTVETTYPELQVKELEKLSDQRTLIGSTFRLGSYNGHLPYGGLYLKLPRICKVINVVNRLLWILPNMFYGIFINPEFGSQVVYKQNKDLADMRKAFLVNETGVYSKETVDVFKIKVRDEVIYKTLSQDVGRYSKENPFLVLIGMAHLSYNAGIISHFENQGYTVRAMDLDAE